MWESEKERLKLLADAQEKARLETEKSKPKVPENGSCEIF